MFRVYLIILTAATLFLLLIPAAPDAKDPLFTLNDAAITSVRSIPTRPHRGTYSREEFGGWARLSSGCTTREELLASQWRTTLVDCKLMPTRSRDPYSGQALSTEDAIELDHVFPLAAAWDLGAHSWDAHTRRRFANDPLNLAGTSRAENQRKSDNLPSAWLPSDQRAHCWYVTRLATVAYKYGLPLPEEDLRVMRKSC